MKAEVFAISCAILASCERSREISQENNLSAEGSMGKGILIDLSHARAEDAKIIVSGFVENLDSERSALLINFNSFGLSPVISQEGGVSRGGSTTHNSPGVPLKCLELGPGERKKFSFSGSHSNGVFILLGKTFRNLDEGEPFSIQLAYSTHEELLSLTSFSGGFDGSVFSGELISNTVIFHHQ